MKKSYRFKNIKSLLFTLLSFIFIVAGCNSGDTGSEDTGSADAEKDEIKLTILGTTDTHGNIYDWSYEDEEQTDDIGMAKIYSVVEEVREENPNTILIDNGDTIQGTILTDDIYNKDLSVENPIIDVMNFMDYDAMVLGNHEFNFGMEMIEKIEEEADFPLLSANTKYEEDDSYLVQPSTVVDVDGLKVGIIGLVTPLIPKWDGPNVTDLYFENMAEATAETIEVLKEKEDIDLIIASAHANFEEDYGNDGAKEIVEENPEIAALLVGHGHVTVQEEVGDTVVAGAVDAGSEVVRFDLNLMQNDEEEWEVVESSSEIIEVEDYEASEELKDYAKEYHEETLVFLEEVLGTASADFAPDSEIEGIPAAQIQDTALIDFINKVQLEATDADVAGAALFNQDSELNEGDLTYADIFDIYKYPNTLVGIEVTGKQLKEYMEWSAEYYNQYEEGDLTISFDPEIRGYKYDMFQGVDYKIDISKPEGERIVDLEFDGEPLKDDQILKLALNNYRYGGIIDEGIIPEDLEPYFESDPKSLRSYLADKIEEEGTIKPEVDNNWEIIGTDFDHPIRDYVVDELNNGDMELPSDEEDGRTFNIESLNADKLIEDGEIPESVLEEHGLD